ncbi:hypothetical protein, partial [Candidatus Methanodesulfokora washburnensis]
MLGRKILPFVLVILILPVYVPSAQYYQPQADLAAVRDKALYISRRAADYVISRAEVEGDGFKWVYQSRYTYYNPIFENGAAGAGYFLLSLYKITGNNTYLRYAEGAARWIISKAASRDGGFTWPHHDDEKPGPDGWYLTPEKSVAGVARFLLELYRTTSKDEYLRYAEGAARWIINAGLRKDVQGSYVDYNPYHQALFGIYSYPQRDAGLLFIDLYRTTGNKEYLDKAKEIGRWIIWTSECTGSICKWYDDRGYGNVYSVEGVSSVADLLYELYLATNDPEYLEVAEKMVNWIESIGVRTNEGIKFPSWDGKFRTITWGWWDRLLFPMTPADIFLKSYEITHNSERLDIAKAYANWLISISVPEGDGVKVPEVEGEGGFHAWINSRVFRFVVMLYNLTGDGRYLDFSEKLLNWISSTAVCENGYVWPTGDGRKIPTFSFGSSGIGYYALAPLTLVAPAKVLDGQITGVSPSSVSMRPGESASFVFTVKNTGSIPADYHVYFPDGSIFGYVSGTISLNPGEYGEITLTGRVPPETSPGTYAVDVYFEMAPHGGVWQRTTIWGRIQVTVLSAGAPKLEITHNFTTKVVSGREFSVNVIVRNTGDREARNVISGIDWSDNAFESMGCTGTLEAAVLKPGEQMQYSCRLKAGSPGTYNVEISAVEALAEGGGAYTSTRFQVSITSLLLKVLGYKTVNISSGAPIVPIMGQMFELDVNLSDESGAYVPEESLMLSSIATPEKDPSGNEPRIACLLMDSGAITSSESRIIKYWCKAEWKIAYVNISKEGIWIAANLLFKAITLGELPDLVDLLEGIMLKDYPTIINLARMTGTSSAMTSDEANKALKASIKLEENMGILPVVGYNLTFPKAPVEGNIRIIVFPPQRKINTLLDYEAWHTNAYLASKALSVYTLDAVLLNPFLGAAFLIGSTLIPSVVDWHYKRALEDPSLNYAQLVPPPTVPPAFRKLPNTTASQALLYEYLYLAYANASAESLARAMGAVQMNATNYIYPHLRNAQMYASNASLYYSKLAPLLIQMVDELNRSGYISEENFRRGQEMIREQGLPNDVVRLLDELGFTNYMDARNIESILKNISYTELNITEVKDALERSREAEIGISLNSL